jgi:oligopeptide/dipeptide ABC transporter ATP-binding protein
MPYTAGLLGSLPRLDGSGRERLTAIPGSPPALLDLAPGCPFAPRCPHRIGVCEEREPELLAVAGPQHRAACHRSGEVTLLRGAGAGDRAPSEEVAEEVAAALSASTASAADQSAAPDREAEIGEPEAAAEPDRASRPTVLDVRGLIKHHPLTKGNTVRKRIGTVRAVDGITFDIRAGESLAVVGESGCGKTTTVMEILRLRAPQGGAVRVLGSELGELSRGRRRRSAAVRRGMAAVFQDPLASLDPRLPVGDVLGEPLRTHGVGDTERTARVQELLRLVGLEPEHANRYPREFSGGQRQRVAIARALALEPQLVILDEPVSALDVSVRAGVLNLLADLKERLGLAYLFVSHDLAVVRHVADRVAVMHLGRIVEIGDAASVFADPRHPYTQALLSAVPIPDPVVERHRRRIVLEGDPPSAVVMDSDRAGLSTPLSQGCRFRSRCPLFKLLDDEARAVCEAVDPELTDQVGDHQAACHHVDRR